MKIIVTDITPFQYEELKNFMRNCIRESMQCVDDLASIDWYRTCSMGEYFTEWSEIWDEEDNLIGEGLDAISHKFVINDETRSTFENAFEDARDEAFEDGYCDFSEKLYGMVSGFTPYPEEDPRSYDCEAWLTDGEPETVFIDENGKHYYKIKEDFNEDSSWIVISFDDDGLIERC